MKRFPFIALTGAALVGWALLRPAAAGAQVLSFDEAREVAATRMDVERVALGFLPVYNAFASSNEEVRWVQLDLGSEQVVDSFKLLPSTILWGRGAGGWPQSYKLEVSHEPTFAHPIVIVDRTERPNNFYPVDEVVTYDTKRVRCRYVRLTATKLRDKKLCLSRIMVMQGTKDLAVGARATDSNPETSRNLETLTAPHRPDGEFVVNDHPENVIPPAQWRPVKNVVETPLKGISMKDGLFKTVMQNNVNYLQNSFTKEELVRNFKEKAGLPVAPPNPKHNVQWMHMLPGSEAGRYLMGAGNTLRWMPNPAMRAEMDYIVNVIDSCREPDGWLMAYEKRDVFTAENGAYARSWVTHGLIDAGLAGNPKAFGMLRAFYDYMDRSPFLPQMLRRCLQGTQGVIPFTRTYFSPAGRPEDITTVMRYFQQNFFMDSLAARCPDIIWRYPYDRPHNYLLTAIEPYFDLYRATGAQKYLDAVRGAWDLYHDNWETPGGGMSINEGEFLYAPKSYWLHKQSGELCGNVFWIKINQRFHNLWPEQEKYVAEVEKSIYNVALANQIGGTGIRYFARLDSAKYGEHNPGYGFAENTCCEGQGTRIYGSLPEHLYSLAPDGVYVDLYAASTVSVPVAGGELGLDVSTAFPYGMDVAIAVTRGARAKVRLRMPSWATGRVAVRVNGKTAAQGRPGTYLTLDRNWQVGDRITFTLPAAMRTTLYTGVEPGFEHNCYAIEYGPVLMAAVAVNGWKGHVRLNLTPKQLSSKLRPIEGRPLHFTIDGNPDYELWPYFEVQEERFSCFPQMK